MVAIINWQNCMTCYFLQAQNILSLFTLHDKFTISFYDFKSIKRENFKYDVKIVLSAMIFHSNSNYDFFSYSVMIVFLNLQCDICILIKAFLELHLLKMLIKVEWKPQKRFWWKHDEYYFVLTPQHKIKWLAEDPWNQNYTS